MHGFETRGEHVDRGRFVATGRFGRLFPELRTLRTFEPGPVALGGFDGPMNGGALPPGDRSQDNPRIKAGYTFLGQFLDHDLTFDATSILERQIDPQATRNFRTPAFELDSVYGLGPTVQPYLYDGSNRFRLLLSEDGHDLDRNRQGTALIADPRNDENILISQLQILFIKFHNKVFEKETSPSASLSARFEEAQTLVRWHYQWMLLHGFLARTVGTRTLASTLAAPVLRFDGEPFMPVEFSVAAYRFGHSQLRPGYPIGAGGGAALFPNQPDAPFDRDMRGGRKLPPELRVDWALFFGPSATPGLFIDTRLSPPMLRLPNGVVPPETSDDERSLAIRNLKRGLDASLPSGEAVASRLAIADPLTEEEVWAGVEGGRGPSPLWFYVLREAEKRAGGMRLSGVGAWIVAQVFVGLMLADRASYLAQRPLWRPTLGGAEGRFTMEDLINYTLDETLDVEDVATLEGDDGPGDDRPAETAAAA